MKSITMSGANSQALIVCLICRSVLDDLEDNLVDNDLKLEDCQEQLSLGALFPQTHLATVIGHVAGGKKLIHFKFNCISFNFLKLFDFCHFMHEFSKNIQEIFI